VISSQDNQECSQHPVEEDGYASAYPPLLRIKSHSQGVPYNHGYEVDASPLDQACAETWTGSDEIPVTADKVPTNLTVENNDQDLTREQPRIRQHSGKPSLHRRKERDMKKGHQCLAQNSEAKQ